MNTTTTETISETESKFVQKTKEVAKQFGYFLKTRRIYLTGLLIVCVAAYALTGVWGSIAMMLGLYAWGFYTGYVGALADYYREGKIPPNPTKAPA